jgi:hypothetical protein
MEPFQGAAQRLEYNSLLGALNKKVLAKRELGWVSRGKTSKNLGRLLRACELVMEVGGMMTYGSVVVQYSSGLW